MIMNLTKTISTRRLVGENRKKNMNRKKEENGYKKMGKEINGNKRNKRK